MSTRLIIGDCRAVLPTLAAGSVQCVVTSPPYYGLRDYGVPPSIWGGNPDCEHEWGDQIAANATNHTGKARWNHTRNGRDELQPVEKRVARLRTTVKQGQFCQKCNAWAGTIGLEPTPQLFVEHVVEVFRELWRVLRNDGTVWLNLGDSFSGSTMTGGNNGINSSGGPDGYKQSRQFRKPSAGDTKPKDLMGMPWRVALALQDDGWYLRRDIIWNKPNPMPESVTDRPTTAHEYVFLLTKRPKYFYDAEAVREPQSEGTHERFGKNPAPASKAKVAEPGNGIKNNSSFNAAMVSMVLPNGRNLRSVWTIPTAPFAEAHFATFPPKLAETCILAGTSERGACPACGAAWVRLVERGEPDKTTTRGQQNWSAETGQRDSAGGLPVRISSTTGWRPTCDCPPADPVRCVVLDPFSGAGTVGLVADRLQRDAVLIELNPGYADMTQRRITRDAGLFAAVS